MGNGDTTPRIVNPITGAGELTALHLGRCAAGEKEPPIPIGLWMDPRTDLIAVEKNKISFPCQKSYSISPVVQFVSLVSILTELSRILMCMGK
jgi:hypothetical protein